MVTNQTKTPLVDAIAQTRNLPTRTNRRIKREAEAVAGAEREAEGGTETRAETKQETTHLTLRLFATDATNH